MSRRIGVDFNNTIICYDDVMHQAAVQQGLVPSSCRMSKHAIRDMVRQLPHGEQAWQHLQGVVYGVRIHEARLIEGVQEFFQLCKRRHVPVHIVSHKTTFGPEDEGITNLRAAALGWMEAQGFFEESGLGISTDDVYFESTRHDKIERIKAL